MVGGSNPLDVEWSSTSKWRNTSALAEIHVSRPRRILWDLVSFPITRTDRESLSIVNALKEDQNLGVCVVVVL